MKKITLLITLFIATCNFAQNLIENHSFELHGVGYLYTSANTDANPYWYTTGGNNVRLFQNAALAQDQTNFVNIGANANTLNLRQDFTVEEDTEYNVSLWYQIWASSTTVTTLHPTVTMRLTDGTTVVGSIEVLDGSRDNQSAWVEHTYTFNSGSNTDLIFYIERVPGGPVTRIDNVSVKAASAASLADLEQFSFKSYPNPAKDIINISAAKNIDKIQIYDLLGKEVLNRNVESRSTEINVSNLAKGMYLVKAFIEDAVGTYKFIKE